MQLDPTAIEQINSGAAGSAGSSPYVRTSIPGANGVAGGDGTAEIFPVSDDTYFDPTVALDLAPYVSGGSGGYGTPGIAGTEGQAKSSGGSNLSYPNAGPGGNGGSSGAGGAAEIDLDNDQFGSLADPLGGGSIIDLETVGGNGAYAADGGPGGDGGSDVSFGTPVYEVVTAGLGGNGGTGGLGGAGGSATDAVAGLSEVTSAAAVFDLVAFGGYGLRGGHGGASGDGQLVGATGDGGRGGAGGNATSSLSDSTISSLASISVTLTPEAGWGGAGGVGGTAGEYLNSGTEDSNNENTSITVAGTPGAGGAGGAAGAATAVFTGNILTAPDIAVSLSTTAGTVGTGGAGGPASASGEYFDSSQNTEYFIYGTPAGATGAAGQSQAGQITMTDNTLTVTGTLSLSLLTPSASIAFNNGSGYNLTFSGNSFIGDGTSELDLSHGAPNYVINDLTGQISDAGSPLNTISGFNSFILSTGDLFVQPTGTQATVVTLAPDPNTIVLTPGHANLTLIGATSANLILNFDGYGSALPDLAHLVADTAHNGNGDTVITLPGDGSVTLSGFTFTPSTANTVLNTGPAPCYCAGTAIRTEFGERPVETLRVGDRLLTAAGTLRPIKWIGHRRVDCRRHADPRQVWPIRVAANAFDAARPHRDLRLSPDHAVFIDGVLIPIRYLVNGRTIRRDPVDSVTYWHVELARHDVILAENLPCESFLDTGNRADFDNGRAATRRHPGFALRAWATKAAAPLILRGPELEAARSWLLHRAAQLGHIRTHVPNLHAVAEGVPIPPEILGRRYRFHVPANANVIRLCSRMSVPTELQEHSSDPRPLGVAVSALCRNGQPIPLADPSLTAGWHAMEQHGDHAAWRWTNGDARLAISGQCVIDVEVAMAGPYWSTPRQHTA